MKIGLYNLEPHIVNTAMMQVSQFHKQKGDNVELYNHFFPNSYDKIYAFSIFDFTSKAYIRPEMICGGTGFDINSRLPEEIEACDYDWSLYPNCNFSIIWFSRGCIRNCDFCVVRQKEGHIKSVQPKNLNPNGKYIRVQDNNFFSNPDWRDAITKLKKYNQPVDFEGVDVRILNKEQCDALNSLKHHKQIHIAWDNYRVNLLPKIKEIIKYIKPYKIMCYVLIGNGSTEEQDLHRIKSLDELGIDPYVMKMKKNDPYQSSIARWCNKPMIRKTCAWKDYKRRVSQSD